TGVGASALEIELTALPRVAPGIVAAAGGAVGIVVAGRVQRRIVVGAHTVLLIAVRTDALLYERRVRCRRVRTVGVLLADVVGVLGAAAFGALQAMRPAALALEAVLTGVDTAEPALKILTLVHLNGERHARPAERRRERFADVDGAVLVVRLHEGAGRGVD